MNETEPSDNGVRADLSASKYRFGEMGSSPGLSRTPCLGGFLQTVLHLTVDL
jgi:hypothetical protein